MKSGLGSGLGLSGPSPWVAMTALAVSSFPQQRQRQQRMQLRQQQQLQQEQHWGCRVWMVAPVSHGLAPCGVPWLRVVTGRGRLGAAALLGGPAAGRLGWNRSRRFRGKRPALGFSAPLAVVRGDPLWEWACLWAWGMEEMAPCCQSRSPLLAAVLVEGVPMQTA